MTSAWEIPAGWGPIVGLLIAAGVIVLAVEWRDRRDAITRYIDRRAKAERLFARDVRRGR